LVLARCSPHCDDARVNVSKVIERHLTRLRLAFQAFSGAVLIASSLNPLAAQSTSRSVVLTACDTLPSGDTRIASCAHVAKLDTTNPTALRRLVADQIINAQWAKALETSGRLSRLDTAFRDATRDSILSLAKDGRFDMLSNHFLGSMPDPYSARVIGFALERLGMIDIAAKYYELMAAGLSEEPRAQILYGKALGNANRPNEALRALSEATDTTRSAADVRAQAWFEMSTIALAQHHPATALSYLKRARCANPRLADSTFWLDAYQKSRVETGLDSLLKYRKSSNRVTSTKKAETWPCDR
jgi:tetratricopeptide (TPR) repeat protein